MKIYLCNEDGDITRDVCHPKFNELLNDDFFISIIEEFSPFGNDEGWDTLRNLEKYYLEQGEKLFLLDFLDDYLHRWGWNSYITLPKLREEEIGEILKIKRDDKYFLTILPQIIIATFFGQFKILGFVDDWIKAITQSVITQQSILTRHQKINGDIDLSKLIKVVDGASTRKDNKNKTSSIFDNYLEVLIRYDSIISKVPEKKIY